jgi:hypothetical protein
LVRQRAKKPSENLVPARQLADAIEVPGRIAMPDRIRMHPLPRAYLKCNRERHVAWASQDFPLRSSRAPFPTTVCRTLPGKARYRKTSCLIF